MIYVLKVLYIIFSYILFVLQISFMIEMFIPSRFLNTEISYIIKNINQPLKDLSGESRQPFFALLMIYIMQLAIR